MSIHLTMWRLTRPAYERASRDGVVYAEHTEELEEISKSWDELQRILGDGELADPPLTAQAICGGETLPNEDMDYGGVKLISPERVVEIHDALAQLTEDEFARRYNDLDFTGAYSSGDGGRPGRTVDTLLDLFGVLRQFYAEGAKHDEAVAHWLG